MCRSKADGGQRCYTHAVQAMTRAENTYRSAYEKTAAAPIARSSAGEVTWAANAPAAEANRVGRTLLTGYGVNQEHLAMIPAGHEYEVYQHVETGMNRDGAYRLIAEHGRGEGLRLYAEECVRNWTLTRTLNGHRQAG